MHAGALLPGALPRTDLRGVYLELGTGDGTVMVGINKPQNAHQ
jgi:hypothetical protein